MKIIKPSVELINITKNAEKEIEKAARICYNSQDKITEDSYINFCKGLINRNHLAPIEFASATFKIITDRAIQNELVRHRLASFTVNSTRYIKYTDEIEVIVPSELKEEDFGIWQQSIIEAEKSYHLLLKNNCKPEIARSVLPLCLKTEMLLSANFRELLHIIELRTSKFAHPDMRIIANKIKEILKKEASSIFGDIK